MVCRCTACSQNVNCWRKYGIHQLSATMNLFTILWSIAGQIPKPKGLTSFLGRLVKLSIIKYFDPAKIVSSRPETYILLYIQLFSFIYPVWECVFYLDLSCKFSKLQYNSLAFVAGFKRATDECSLPEIAQYSPYYLPLNVLTASRG